MAGTSVAEISAAETSSERPALWTIVRARRAGNSTAAVPRLSEGLTAWAYVFVADRRVWLSAGGDRRGGDRGDDRRKVMQPM